MNLAEVGWGAQVWPKHVARLSQGDPVSPVKDQRPRLGDSIAAFGSREVVHQIALQAVVGGPSYALHLSLLQGPPPAKSCCFFPLFGGLVENTT